MTPDQIAALPYRPCVGIMLINRAGDVFTGQRIDNPGPAWQMPQGGVDQGEDPQDAALRELGEETGLPPHLVQIIAQTDGWIPYDLPHDMVPNIWGGKYRGQEQKWFLMQFLGEDTDVNIETDHPEFSAWRWLPPSQLLDNIVPFKRGVYGAVLDAFAEQLKG